MITVEGVTKSYGPKKVVDDVSFEVTPGQVTGFLGTNGAGKSTTMRMMLGLERPDQGRVRYDGANYGALPQPLVTVGGLLDASWVHPSRNARNHLAWLAASNSIPAARVDDVLELVGLTTVASKRVGTFSLGMRQRLGLAGALLGDPAYLLLDEPMNGLDPEGIHWMRRVIRRLAAEGKGVFVSSHLLAEMAQTADQLVVLGAGRLISNSTVTDFIGDASHAPVLVRTTDPSTLEGLLRAGGATDCTTTTDADGPALHVAGLSSHRIGQIALSAGILIHELTPQQPSLEEVFMRKTACDVEYRATNGTMDQEVLG